MVSSGRAERRLESDAGCGGGGGQTRRSGQRPAEEEAEARQGRLSLLSLACSVFPLARLPVCPVGRSVVRSVVQTVGLEGGVDWLLGRSALKKTQQCD